MGFTVRDFDFKNAETFIAQKIPTARCHGELFYTQVHLFIAEMPLRFAQLKMGVETEYDG